MVEYDARYNVRPVLDNIAVPWAGGKAKHAFVKTAMLGCVPVYLIGSPEYFREVLDSGDLCRKDWESYTFFTIAVLEALKAIKPRWTPKVIHVSSWHSGLIPVYLNALHRRDLNLKNVSVVATAHDIVCQDEFGLQATANAIYGVGRVESGKKVSLLRTAKDYEFLYKTAWERGRSCRQQEIRIANRCRSWSAAA
jgi:hypothetical protein